MPKRKIFYAFEVKAANEGAGQDQSLVKGGYLRNDALPIGSGQYPDKEDQITSLNTAVSQGLAFVRRFQSMGVDARCSVYYGVYGEDVADAIRPLTGAEDGPFEVCRLDTPEKSILKKIRLANTPKGTGEDDGVDDLPQDLDLPVGG